MTLTVEALKLGGRYNWKNQEERLVYIGMCEPKDGRWHQFEEVYNPGEVWCQVLDSDLHKLEETEIELLGVFDSFENRSLYDMLFYFREEIKFNEELLEGEVAYLQQPDLSEEERSEHMKYEADLRSTITHFRRGIGHVEDGLLDRGLLKTRSPDGR